MAKKKLTTIDISGIEYSPEAKRIGIDSGPKPRGPEKPKRTNVFLYARDEKKIAEIQELLKNRFGKVNMSQLIRYALNTANFDNYREGF